MAGFANSLFAGIPIDAEGVRSGSAATQSIGEFEFRPCSYAVAGRRRRSPGNLNRGASYSLHSIRGGDSRSPAAGLRPSAAPLAAYVVWRRGNEIRCRHRARPSPCTRRGLPAPVQHHLSDSLRRFTAASHGRRHQHHQGPSCTRLPAAAPFDRVTTPISTSA